MNPKGDRYFIEIVFKRMHVVCNYSEQ